MTVTINGTTGIAGTNGSAGTPAVQGEDTNTGLFFPAADTVAVATGGSERFRIDNSGFTSIGATSAPAKLAVVRELAAAPPALGSSTGAAFFMGGVSSAYGLIGGVAGAGYTWLQSQRVDGTATAYDLVVQPTGGNLLVGTTSGSLGATNGVVIGPSESAWTTDTSAAVPIRIYNKGGAGTRYLMEFRSSSGAVGTITHNGTNTTYSTSSDYRLKENVAPMQNALDTVAQLNPVTYTWKADGSAGQGFIAHELQAVVPDCVTGEKDAVDADGNPQYQGVDTSFLVATLVKAIQELTARVAELEAK